LPAAPHSGAFAQALGHPGAAHDNPRRTLWRWSRPRAPGSAAANDLPTAPRHAASSHYSRPTLTPRSDPRAERRHRARRALQATPAGPSGSAFPLKTGSVVLLGPTGGGDAVVCDAWCVFDHEIAAIATAIATAAIASSA